jgi:hypothetical protein
MAKQRDLERELKFEQVKLNKLVDDALERGTPLSETHEIMQQSKKVNGLINKVQEKKRSVREPER